MAESSSSFDWTRYSGLNASKYWCGGPALILNNKYQIGKKINAGSFGEVKLARDIQTREVFCVKLESVTAKEQMLANEFNFYKKLGSYVETPNEYKYPEGLPRVVFYGKLGSNNNALVMDFLGMSLSQIFRECRKKFSLKTVLMIAEQLLQRIEYIHERNIVHRDIKLENILIGRSALESQNIIHIVDFGISEDCINWRPSKKETEPYAGKIRGTPRYMSLHTHKKMKHSKRDDLESILYVLVLLQKGQLPWTSCPSNNLDDMFFLKNQDPKIICADLPSEFTTYLEYVRGLEFSENPNYKFLRELFKNSFKNCNFQCDGKFDWHSLDLEKFEFA